MKMTDGLFHCMFDEIASEYPDIISEHQIIDIGAARLSAQPERFDVIVTLNLYGDILSDIAAQIAGSVGLAGSANIGSEVAMFEAVHGSAPDIAGKDVANPSGLLLAAVQMLVHLGEAEIAERVKNAWLCTLEDGIHTTDIYREGLSQEEVGTSGFTEAVIKRLGRKPRVLEPVHYQHGGIHIRSFDPFQPEKALVGVDVFLHWDEAGRDPNILGEKLEAVNGAEMSLTMITNRGVRVYPQGQPETFCTDHWRCRFLGQGETLSFKGVLRLLGSIHAAGFDVIKIENLYTFDGSPGYSRGQDE